MIRLDTDFRIEQIEQRLNALQNDLLTAAKQLRRLSQNDLEYFKGYEAGIADAERANESRVLDCPFLKSRGGR